MKTAELRVSSVEGGKRRAVVCPDSGHSSLVTRHEVEAFTLIELLTVIAIIGLLAVLLAPVLKNFGKPDVTVSATRQMLDDCARARALAIMKSPTSGLIIGACRARPSSPIDLGRCRYWPHPIVGRD